MTAITVAAAIAGVDAANKMVIANVVYRKGAKMNPYKWYGNRNLA